MLATGTSLESAHTSRPIPLFAPTTTICLSVMMAFAVVMRLFRFLLMCAGCICVLKGVPVLNADALLPSMFVRIHSCVNVIYAKLT